MKPLPTHVLAFLAQMMPRYANGTSSPYLRKQLSTAGTLLAMMAEDMDRLVPRLVEEAIAIRRIFADAGGIVVDEDLSAALAHEAGQTCTDLHLTALFAENDHLRELLIRLHTHVETLANDAARDLDAAIWQELVRQGERRRTRFLKS